jgi:outer membrane protein TolC
MAIMRVLGLPVMILVFWEAAIAQTPAAQTQASEQAVQQATAAQAVSPINLQTFDLSGTQNPLMGGIPTGKPTGSVMPLSLSDAIKRGLIYNLGAALSEQTMRATQGARMLALSQLLPRVTTGVTELQEQVNLAAFGFQGFPGMKTIVGPFNVFDVRAYISQAILDFPSLNRYRAENQNLRAAQFSNQNTRDLVVFVVSNLYLQAVASSSRVDAARAQVTTAQTLYNLAVDQRAAGVVPGIEVLRAQVELQAQQQRLIVAEDQFAKDKLSLARAIGLPTGQEFNLVEGMAFVPIPEMTLEDAMQRALKERPDYQSAQARVRSAELDKKAAQSLRLPSLGISADYGTIGQRPWQNHGTFTLATVLNIPVFLGGSIRGRVIEAEAALSQRQAELDDLRGRIYYDIRNAFLDMKAAADRVQVAESAQKLALEQVQQSRDRFAAGVTNNVEVVQAQQQLATASENYISSLQAHSAAKLALARAIGVPGVDYERFMRGK